MVGFVKDLTVFCELSYFCCLSLFVGWRILGCLVVQKNGSVCDGGNDGLCGLLKEVARYCFF